MDGDHSAKTFEGGANSATKATDLTEGIHEGAKQMPGAGDKATGHGLSVFDQQGSIGKQFTADGSIGGAAQKVGGPFSNEGAVGKQFTPSGALGGTAQKLADKNQEH